LDWSLGASNIARRYPWQPCEREPPLLPTGMVILKEFSGKYSPDPILTNTQTPKKGREELEARIRKDSL